jgi:serine/threonine-protein kinase
VQDWTVVRLLGVGGFGFVYEVERDGQRFALKMASQSPGPTDTERLDVRARNEVACLRLLSHPHIVRVHAQGRWPAEDSGLHFFVMDLVEGTRLCDWCLHARPPLKAVVEVGMKLALALAAMHEAGVLHRDLKQDNVLVRPDGEPVIIDFGIATHSGASPLTTHILPPGTTHYRSPESITFFRRRHFEPGGSYAFQPTDDLYALGVLLYETLTGRPPFPPHLPEAQLLGAIEFLPPPSPAALNPLVPEPLSAVVLRLLAKKPEQRYPDGRQLHQALAAVREALESSGEAPFLLEAEDPGRIPTEPLVVPHRPDTALEARPKGEWVNLDELLKLVEAISGTEQQAATQKALQAEAALQPVPPSHEAAPPAPLLTSQVKRTPRRWRTSVVATALVLLAFAAGWALRASLVSDTWPLERPAALALSPADGSAEDLAPAPSRMNVAAPVEVLATQQARPLSVLMPLGPRP